MALITFLGGEETGNVGSVQWGRFEFELNKAVECGDAHIVAKASMNRFFKVEGDIPPPKKRHPLDHDGDGRKGGSLPAADRMAAARAAKAAKHEAEKAAPA